MKLAIQRTTYEDTIVHTGQFWPTYNEQQGIEWDERTFGLLARESARDGSEVVGGATVRIAGGTAFLEQLVVRPEFTRRGIGSALMEAFSELAHECECHVMELETGENQARPFYERHGFVVVATKPNSKFGRNWHWMQKACTSPKQ